MTELLQGNSDSILDEIGLGVALIDFKDGTVARANAKFCDLLDKTRGAVIGQPAADLGIIIEGAYPLGRSKGDLELRRGSGVRHVQETRTPIQHNGRDYLLVELIDITIRKRIEEKLRCKSEAMSVLNQQLQRRESAVLKSKEQLHKKNQALRDVNRTLQANQQQLVQSEKMAGLGQLAAGVAHEINNPVGFVKSNLGTLGEYLAIMRDLLDLYGKIELPEGEISAQIAELKNREDVDFVMSDMDTLLDESAEGLMRVQEIVQNLRTFARLDEIEKKEANINDCIESTLKIVWNELKYKCTVNKDLGELPDIICNPGQLNQVFMNLLVNAGQAIEEKGEIHIYTELIEDEIMVSIRDTGRGIAPENIAKLFDPFFTTKEVGKGTGLGLSISHGIIEEHGGRIEVDSKVGAGTTFTIHLPANQSI